MQRRTKLGMRGADLQSRPRVRRAAPRQHDAILVRTVCLRPLLELDNDRLGRPRVIETGDDEVDTLVCLRDLVFNGHA